MMRARIDVMGASEEAFHMSSLEEDMPFGDVLNIQGEAIRSAHIAVLAMEVLVRFGHWRSVMYDVFWVKLTPPHQIRPKLTGSRLEIFALTIAGVCVEKGIGRIPLWIERYCN